MIKRTLYFGNPAYLSCRYKQLIIKKPSDEELTIPIEDIGLFIVDHAQITLTSTLIQQLLGHNVALVTCNETHHPTGLMLNLDGNTLQSARFEAQINSSLPLKKQLWQQTVRCKILNQAMLLQQHNINTDNLIYWAGEVNSGDTKNHEARAAAYYWPQLFAHMPHFRRARTNPYPNNLLNYGYAILRALTARALVGSGLLPTIGIFHSNKYNAYCLADDIMEPYRPFVDKVVHNITLNEPNSNINLNTAHKTQLLNIPVLDVVIDGKNSPLMVAMSRTTASLAKCFELKQRKILYPEWTSAI